MKQYVQHKSGVGERWKVADEPDNLPLAWRVLNKEKKVNFYLPKSEYILCDPPGEWEDVTHEYTHEDAIYDARHYPDIRLRQIDGVHHGPCFIVERRKSR